MSGLPAPPPPSKQGRQGKGALGEVALPRKRVLIVSAQYFPYVSWIGGGKDVWKVLLTTKRTREEMDVINVKGYAIIETFENFGVNNMVEYRAIQLHLKHNFTHVVCLSEEEMLRTALLRDKFGITHGQDYQSTLRFRDKVIMKQILQQNGLKVPHFAAIENPLDLYQFIQQYGYPVVVKPRRGYGSVNTTVIRNQEELTKFAEKGFGEVVDAPIDMLAESFVTGQMYHIDGFVHEHQKANPLTERIQIFVEKCLKCLEGPDTYPFHAEVWHTPEDELVFCEVASRTGGGGIPTEIYTLYEVLLAKTHSQYQSDEPFTLDTIKTNYQDRPLCTPDSIGWIFIYPKIGKLTIPKLCTEEYVVSYDLYAESGQIYTSRKSCADAVCNFIVKGGDEETCEANIHKIYQWFVKNSHWDPIN